MQKENITPTKQLNCFIIMPFTQASFKDKGGVEHTLNEAELKHIYEELFQKAVKSYTKNNVSFVNVHRSNAQRGNFVKDIVGKLQDYDLVIADLTGSNPNVFYELGIRHTLKNGTVMITQNVSHLPSDLKNYIGVEYKYYEKSAEFSAYYPEFEKKLHSLIDDVLEDENKVDNPVRDYIGDRVIFRQEERIREIEENIRLMEILKIKYCITVESIISFHDSCSFDITQCKFIMSNFFIFAEALFDRLVNTHCNYPPVAFIEQLIISSKIYNPVINDDMMDKLYFGDYKNKIYYMKDLLPYYKISNDEYVIGKIKKYKLIDDDEPISSSFDYFIDEWKKELNELTGE